MKDYAPEAVEEIVGVSAQAIREAMRMFAAAPSATIMWGMGVTQFGQAVDVVRGLASLALLTGNLGRRTSVWARFVGKIMCRAPAIWACCRTCSPAIRRSLTRRAGQIRRRLGDRPGADG